MVNYDELIAKLRLLLRKHLYVEDNELYVKCGMKYDTVTLMFEEDKKWVQNLFDELEYKGEV